MQFFEETDPVKKQAREKEMMSLTLRSVTTPATSTAGGGALSQALKPKAYDMYPMSKEMSHLLNSDSGSFQMVGSNFGGNMESKSELMDGISDAAMRKVMSEHIT